MYQLGNDTGFKMTYGHMLAIPSKGICFYQGHKVPPNPKLWLPLSHVGLLVPVNQQQKKGVPILAEVTKSDYYVEIGFFYISGVNGNIYEAQKIH